MGDLSKHFSRKEFACKCRYAESCNHDTVDAELILVLEVMRTYFNQPIIINSGCRCQDHNKAVGGSVNSQHLHGKAADIVVNIVFADRVADYLERSYQGKYGIGRYNGRTHIDVRPDPVRWDMRT